MNRLRLLLAIVLTSAAAIAGVVPIATAAGAAVNGWPHTAVNGFSTPNGDGFWLLYRDGTVAPYGAARFLGDASNIALNGPIVGGAVAPDGKGYWLVARDGGIFTYGSARFFGSMGGTPLNQPVFAMAPTTTGKGYWLVARDGGIFSFGDARFHGSTGNLTLQQPINGITTSPTGQGYRMIARDGGTFSFGDAAFYGSLPGLGLIVDDVAGMAPTPSNRGYWIARAGGELYAFGDAHAFNDVPPPSCDPIVGIFSNPKAQGFRLVLRSGATVPVGKAPGGAARTGPVVQCPPPVDLVVITFDEYERITVSMTYADVVYIVGGDGRLTEDYKAGGHDHAFYTWHGPGGATALIEFRDYEVASKAQVALNPPGMSLGEYLGVSVGMSYGEVAYLVGGPGALVAASNVGGYETTLYSWSGNGGSALVRFENNREVAKTEVGLR